MRASSPGRPQLIATDLDGTLLGADHRISPFNRSAIARAAELGIPFVVATGRPTRWLEPLREVPGLHSSVVVSNGAAIYDLNASRISHHFPLASDTAAEVMAALRREIPGTTFGFESLDDFACEPGCPTDEAAARASLAEVSGPLLKLLAFHQELSGDDFAALAETAAEGRLTITHSTVGAPYSLLELSAPAVSKASTLALICADLGISASEVAAFGDMPNDRAMLEWAGQGFVVGNAHPSLLGDFPVVASHDQDGVGRAVLELLG